MFIGTTLATLTTRDQPPPEERVHGVVDGRVLDAARARPDYWHLDCDGFGYRHGRRVGRHRAAFRHRDATSVKSRRAPRHLDLDGLPGHARHLGPTRIAWVEAAQPRPQAGVDLTCA